MSSFTREYLHETAQILQMLDIDQVDACINQLVSLRNRHGRLFILGVGGSAANASHAVNDFRKICNIEAYAPTDNVAELTARINDNVWSCVFLEWLTVSRLTSNDLIMVLSVNGGTQRASSNIVRALKFAEKTCTPIIGIVGRASGYTAKVATACIIVPIANEKRVTPHAEEFQSVFWHLFCHHPDLVV